MKKITALTLVLTLIISLFAGCGQPSQPNDNDEIPTQSNSGDVIAEEPIELTLTYCSATIQPSEDNIRRIEAAINEHTIPDLNIKVTLNMPSMATYFTTLGTEITTGASDYDVMLLVSALIPTFASYGFLADITEPLQEYGQDLLNSYGDPAIASAMNVNGRIYCVPVHKENAWQSTVMMRKDIVDKYNIDVSAIQSLEDLEKVYEQVSAQEPDMLMLALSSYGTTAGLAVDDLGSGVPMGLINPTTSTEVVSYADTQEFADYCATLHRWYENGWIEQGVTSNPNAVPQDYIAAGKAFSTLNTFSHPLAEADFEAQCNGTDMVMVSFGDQIITNAAAAYFGYGVSATTKDVNKSVQLLNYICTNSDVMNLLNWGEEGVDYVVTENGTLDYPDGVTLENVGYHLNSGWALPNQLICTPWCTMEPDIYEQIDTYNQQGILSKGFGMTFDQTNVANEMTAVLQVVNQYYNGLITGELDPDKYIPIFQEELKKAGSEAIIAEMQKQLDALLAQ